VNERGSAAAARVGALLVLLLGVALASSPLWGAGLPFTVDGTLHLHRSVEFIVALREGVLAPRWAATMFYGQGQPLFLYAPPLYSYLVALPALAGLNLELATKGVIVLALLLGATGAYRFLRGWLTCPLAALGALCFLLAPFRLREIYFQGDLPQLLAMSLLPWWLAALQRFIMRGGRWPWLGATCCGVALVLTHLITTMLHAPVAALWAVGMLLWRRAPRARWLAVGASFALVLALTAFFSLPLAAGSGAAHLEQGRSGDHSPLHHFVTLGELLSPSLATDANAVNPDYPHNLGLAQWVLALPSLWLLRDRRARPLVAAGWLLVLGGISLMLPISRAVWQTLPLLSFAQFPWRLLGLLALPLAALDAASLSLLRGRRLGAGVALVTVALVVSAMAQLYPVTPRLDYTRLALSDLVRYEVETGTLGTTSSREYLPATVAQLARPSGQIEAFLRGENPERLDRAALPSGATAALRAMTSVRHVYALDTATAFQARLFLHDYPGWRATLDGQPAPHTHNENGHILVEVPAGQHVLAVAFEETSTQRLAALLSLATLGGVMALMVITACTPGFCTLFWGEDLGRGVWQYAPTADVPASTLLLLAALLALLLLGKEAYVDGHTRWFRRASPLDRIPGSIGLRVTLGQEEMRFLGLRPLARTAFQPGETLELDLYWERLGTTRDLRSTLQLLDLRGERVAQVDNLHPAGIPVSSWQKGKFCRDRLRLAIPADLPPGTYRPIAKLYDEAGALVVQPLGLPYVPLPVAVTVGAPPRAQKAEVTFGAALALASYRFTPTRGGPSPLVLTWEVKQPPSRAWTTFVQVLDRQGNYLTGFDGPSLEGVFATTDWPLGARLEEVRALPLQSLAAGEYRLALGLYDPQSGARAAAGLPGEAFVVPFVLGP
jgi:hypothetical protein